MWDVTSSCLITVENNALVLRWNRVTARVSAARVRLGDDLVLKPGQRHDEEWAQE